jgi:hypothetical protein
MAEGSGESGGCLVVIVIIVIVFGLPSMCSSDDRDRTSSPESSSDPNRGARMNCMGAGQTFSSLFNEDGHNDRVAASCYDRYPSRPVR